MIDGYHSSTGQRSASVMLCSITRVSWELAVRLENLWPFRDGTRPWLSDSSNGESPARDHRALSRQVEVAQTWSGSIHGCNVDKLPGDLKVVGAGNRPRTLRKASRSLKHRVNMVLSFKCSLVRVHVFFSISSTMFGAWVWCWYSIGAPLTETGGGSRASSTFGYSCWRRFLHSFKRAEPELPLLSALAQRPKLRTQSSHFGSWKAGAVAPLNLAN